MTDAALTRRGHLHLEIREFMPVWQQSMVFAGGLGVGLVISIIILVISGVGLGDIVNEFVVAIFSSPKTISAVLVQAAPLIIVGLSAAIAFKARFWNIGIEGQVIFGGFGATLIAIFDIGPESTRLLFMAVAAAIGGMAWMALPVFLKIRLRVNEIITTLLMNYIAVNMLLHMLYGPWQDPVSAFPHSEQFDPVERFSSLGFQGLNVSLIIALAFVALLFWLLMISRFGYLLNFVQQNASMARAMGIRVSVIIAVAALVSGALSGVAGFVMTAGTETRLTQSFFVGFTFSGILIAFLARNNPIAVVFVALFVAVLIIAGQSLQVFYQIPFAMVQLIQAIIFITVAASEFLIRHRIRWVP